MAYFVTSVVFVLETFRNFYRRGEDLTALHLTRTKAQSSVWKAFCIGVSEWRKVSTHIGLPEI